MCPWQKVTAGVFAAQWDQHQGGRDLQHQADALIELGDAQQAAGNSQAAREAWRFALTILDGLHHPGVTPFRARLARVS